MGSPDQRSRTGASTDTANVSRPNGQRDGSTTRFSVASLGLESLAGLPATADRVLNTLRTRLAECRVITNGSDIYCETAPDDNGLMYTNLPTNLRGAWVIKVNGYSLLLGCTRHNWVFLCDKPSESFYEDHAFMRLGINLSRCDLLRTRTGKDMFLYQVTRGDVDKLHMLAAGRNVADTAPSDTLVPREGRPVLTLEEVKEKLIRATEVKGNGQPFDLTEFVSTIRFATPLRDAEDRGYYCLFAGTGEQLCHLYVNAPGFEPPGFDLVARFKYNTDFCTLFMEQSP